MPTDSKGQAMVEYILMLVVTMTLLLGVATKLIPQLRDFMQNYAGAYVECLLETGELPPPLNLNPNSLCSFENMQASGRFNNISVVRGGSSGGRRNNNNSRDSSASAGNGGSSGGSGGRGGGGSSPRQRIGSNTGADSSAGGSSSGSKGPSRGDKLAAAANTASAKAQRSQGAGNGVPYSVQEDNGRGITGVVKIPNNSALADEKNLPPKTIKSDNKMDGDNLRKGSFTAPITKSDENNRGPNSSMDLGFPYGLYLRYFIIGGLILALILMVGTQLNTLRKSWGSE